VKHPLLIWFDRWCPWIFVVLAVVVILVCLFR